jgi:hypothetical protein
MVQEILLDLWKDASWQWITLHTVIILICGFGARVVVSWVVLTAIEWSGRHITEPIRKNIKRRVSYLAVPTQIIAALLVTWGGGKSFKSAMVVISGFRVPAKTNTVINFGIEWMLFSFGTIAIYSGIMIFLKVLEKKYKIQILSY